MSRSSLLFLVLLAAPLAAQQSPERAAAARAEVTRLERERDSVGELWRQARDLVILQDSLAHVTAVGRLDTVTIGSIRIITNRPDMPFREAAERYWPSVDSLYGDAARQLYDTPVRFQVIKPVTSRGKQPRVERWGLVVEDDIGVKDLVGLLRGALRVRPPDSALRIWLPGEIYPSFFGDSAEVSEAYVALVTSGYEVARRCFAGDMKSCAVALRLDDGNDSMVHAVLATAEERRDRISMLDGYYRRERNLEGLAECRGGDDAICLELLSRVPPHMIPQPFAPQARMVLVRLALRAGGKNAYSRLMSDSLAPIGQRLANASGMPVDTLLSQWRNTIIAGRPLPISISLVGVLTGLGWVALLGYFGLRSSRWRMG